MSKDRSRAQKYYAGDNERMKEGTLEKTSAPSATKVSFFHSTVQKNIGTRRSLRTI